jgi:hypothetical protein
MSKPNRSPERITPLIERLKTVWQADQNYHLRLGQLIMNVYREDIYNIEDEEFIQRIERFYAKRR